MLVALLGFGMPDGQTASHVTNVPNVQLGGGNSNIFYFHPEPWGNDPI